MNTIKVDGTGSVEHRLKSLEQAVNYGEVILPFPVVGEVEGGGGATGPQGPAGPGVAAGGTTGQVLSKASALDYDTTWTTLPALAYRHVQASAATVWTITHNLVFRPNVTAVDSTGQVIIPGTVLYTSATTVQLTFSAAIGGEAYAT
jgi:hypothetical protein